MPVKIIGALAIIASCSMLGFEMSSELIKRVRALEGWQNALQKMAGFVEYAKMPLHEIYETLAEEKTVVGAFFERVRKCRDETAEKCWVKNLAEIHELTKNDREILKNLAAGLGKGDTETQIKDIEFALNLRRVYVTKVSTMLHLYGYNDNEKNRSIWKQIVAIVPSNASILKDELKVKDYNDFKAYYCGLCKSLGNKYNQFVRFGLNYDLTFLAVLLVAFIVIANLFCNHCSFIFFTIFVTNFRL